MGVLASLIGAVLNAFFQAVATAWKSERERADLDDVHERAGVAEAANETQQIMAEVADARSRLPDNFDDPDALARRLRSRKTTADRSDTGDQRQDDSRSA